MDTGHEEVEEQAAIVANAARLLKDARLLMEHDRHASAYALSVIAMEEFGKIIILRWKSNTSLPPPKKLKTSHIQKQTAVSCVLVAKFVVLELTDTIKSHKGDDKSLIEIVAKTVYSSSVGIFFKEIDEGLIEKAKHIALYRDKDPQYGHIKPERFSGMDPLEIIDRCYAVAEVIWNAQVMHVARALYDTRTDLTIRLLPEGRAEVHPTRR